ncbi:MAG: tetratricopeptide repeat protein, partial [Candidatus Eisenbacteria bacterium]|nr:tetratricopeptide repeat protein [Candidatus Eisenbacteria bacterium]
MSLFTKLFGLGDNDHYNKGIEHYNRGEYDKAVVEFENVISTIRDRSDPYYQLGMFYAAETHAHLGFAFYKQGDLDRAEAEFRKAVQENTRYPDLHYHLGVIYERQGLHEKAAESLLRAIEINPEYMEAYCQLAIAFSEQGKSAEAAEAFEKATRFGLTLPTPEAMKTPGACERLLTPPYEELRGATIAREEFRNLINDAITAYNAGRTDEAIRGFEEAVALKPQYPDIRCRLAIAYGELERYEEAVGQLREALAINPDYIDALFYHGVYSLKLGKYREACESLKRGVEIEPDYWDLRCYLGVAFFKRGMFNESGSELARVAASCPRYALAHYYLGMTKLSQGETRDAVKAFKIAFDDPQFRHEVPGESADIMLESGEYDVAIERYNAAISANPSYADLHCGLGMAYLARSSFGDAERALEEALR